MIYKSFPLNISPRFGVYLWTFGFTFNPYSHSVLFKLGGHQTSKMQDLVLNNTSLFHQAVTLQSVSINTTQPISTRVKSKLIELNNGGNLAHLKNFNKENGHSPSQAHEDGHHHHQYHQNGSVEKKNNVNGRHEEKPPSKDNSSKQQQLQPCVMSPDTVRYEAQCLRTDFNLRIKQILFNSIVSAYYIGFIPLKFTQVYTLFSVYYELTFFQLIVWRCLANGNSQHGREYVYIFLQGNLFLCIPLPTTSTFEACSVCGKEIVFFFTFWRLGSIFF